MVLGAVGNVIAAATTSLGARFFAMFLMPMGILSACKFVKSTGPGGEVIPGRR